MIAVLALIALRPPAALSDLPANPGLEIRFTMERGGSFDITTFPTVSHKTVAQILRLAKSGFYDRQRVHRVESWVTQWGSPASRTQPLNSDAVGDGESGHPLLFEMSDIDFTRGIVGSASNGLQMGGDSQLFVIKTDRLYLYHSYAVVGKVTRGMDVVDHIKKGDRIKSATVLPYPVRTG